MFILAFFGWGQNPKRFAFEEKLRIFLFHRADQMQTLLQFDTFSCIMFKQTGLK
jgi:hypothetical protein